MTDEEYGKVLKKFHKLSDRHILVVETDMPYSDAMQVVALSDRIHKAGNELVSLMRKNYTQLLRTKKYRKLLKLYGDTEDKDKRKALAKQLNDMQSEYNVTWDYCRASMIPIGKKYGVDAVFALTKAEDVWHGIEKCLFGSGKTIHFSKYGELPCIRAKQINRGIPMSVKNNKVQFKLGKTTFGLQINDRFQTDEINAVLSYLAEPEITDAKAVDTLLDEAYCIDTYRPCYATLVPKIIRGKYRVYLHLTIEGKAKPKYDKYGNPRYKYSKGMIGADIGTQTVAFTSDTEVGLKNLSERGNSIQKSERLERLYYRAMDRSRRATNPQNYNPDGTVKKGHKTWKYSNHYRKLKAKHSELCRINAANRQLAINEDANHLRSLGDVFVTEPKNASKLMKRAKETTKNNKGKFNKKKRFGKSIKNRCPSGFQTTIEKKFKSSGGIYIEVPQNYRASQYDHTADDYIKKKLSDRIYKLTDGTRVQRDWYSSFLLYCYDFRTQDIDKAKCNTEFDRCYAKEKALIAWIKANKIKVLNSGIKIA
ncbi:hypothetical protein [Butyrivibrio sp.]|uniref:hypothetical protein n=1 Tax=Butyrivibrio sp. TaxID=28121 RepID=UPI0025C6384B|nr:hypothetical protein [Butyrivibrio sp.]MBQ7428413.1 hypothetical protein [Butyrivibrio sp.]MBQ9303344.1 hypothetical protein [Butyrivibrio sp.]